jgi:tRNA 2-thiouridine synthesizing protein A
MTDTDTDGGGPTVLDVRGLQCPLPVLRANKALRALAPGAVLEVQATDPAAPRDFVNFCETTGHALIESHEAAGVFTMIIRKKA